MEQVSTAFGRRIGYFSSAIGRKQVMGFTGLAWAGFVMSHMLGNILIFAGPEAYNKYSYALVSNPLIYLAEAGLVLTILVHIIYGVQLKRENTLARRKKNAMPTNGAKAARPQSKYMIFHGSLILVFIVLHIAHFKYGPDQTEGYVMTVDGVVMRDLHRLVVETFQSPLYMGWYAVALIGVGLHLSHGFYSSFASLGFYHPKYSAMINKIGYAYSAIVAIGFLAPPIYIFIRHLTAA